MLQVQYVKNIIMHMIDIMIDNREPYIEIERL